MITYDKLIGEEGNVWNSKLYIRFSGIVDVFWVILLLGKLYMIAVMFDIFLGFI